MVDLDDDVDRRDEQPGFWLRERRPPEWPELHVHDGTGVPVTYTREEAEEATRAQFPAEQWEIVPAPHWTSARVSRPGAFERRQARMRTALGWPGDER